jgi:hypothetical protein
VLEAGARARDGDRFGRASVRALLGEFVGGRESPRASGQDANAQTGGVTQVQAADLAVLDLDVLAGELDRPDVGVGSAAGDRGVQGLPGEVFQKR